MAKAKKFGDGYEWIIKPSSKNSTWVYDGSGNSDYYRVSAEFSEKDLKTYHNKYYNVVTKDNNDLIITTVFVNKKNFSTKLVKTTIKISTQLL